ncbi:MAG TPA: hypothetical protein P5531_04410 [Bacteroidales bacterium]|nr:hypothetical protein [Bacteroidales bacterium]HSA42754.1 hypothetical protein [Bacteroidales bacterium]
MHYQTVFSLLLASCTCLQAFSQENTYLSSNPVWRITSICNTGGYCIQNEDYNYFTDGDTLVGQVQYKMMYRKGEGSYFWMSAPPVPPGCSGTYWYINPQPSFLLRSEGKQMYIRELADTAEHLLYDFDLEAGDSLPLTYNNFSNNVYVSFVDSFPTPQGYRKKFSLSGDTWSQYLLEGIGHDMGLTEPLQIPLECGYQLTCFSLDDTACYPAIGPGCNLPVGHEEKDLDDAFSMLPNPASSVVILQSKYLLQGATLSVFNCYGQKIREIHNMAGTTCTIDCSGLSQGLYIFSLMMPDKAAHCGKMLICRQD